MSDSRRQCLLLDLIDDADLIAAYCDWHTPGKVPAAVIASIRAAGIVDMQIYNAGDRLVMIMEVGPDFDPATKAQSDAQDPDIQAWETLMWRFQKALPFAGAGEKWVAATRIFSLAEQP
jgi:L-rhamnose mutarotase